MYRAASMADSSPATTPLPLRVEPKPKSGIRQQDLLKKVVEIKPKRQKVSSPSPSDGDHTAGLHNPSTNIKSEVIQKKEQASRLELNGVKDMTTVDNPVKSLLGLSYDSSDNED